MGANKRVKQWTIAGAARAARDARLATVKYLSRSELAVRLQLDKLVQAYQVRLPAFGGNPSSTMLSLFGGMGYDRPPSDWHAAAEMVVADEARCLAQAQLYVLSPHMCDVVVAAAQSLTTEDLYLIDETDLPTPTGLIMLPEALLTRSVDGNLSDLRAFTWTTPASAFLGSRKQQRVLEHPAARISRYHDTHGPVQPADFRELQDYARALGTPLPPLLLDAIRTLVFRPDPAEDSPDLLRRASAWAREHGELKRTALARDGQDIDEVVGEHTPGAVISDTDDTFTLRFLTAFWRLCAQGIGEHENAPVTHSARVAAQQTGSPPDVRIVQIRSKAHSDAAASEGATGKAWQHRWVVRMHKVRQWYPSLQAHKVIYRGPYIKGPADKPLLGGEVVRAVTR